MSDRFMNGVYTEFSIGLSNMWIGHLICRADYNPDQYLWEVDFTLAGRNTKDRTLRQMYYFKFEAKESKRPHLAVQSLCGFTFPGGHSSTLCCILPWKQFQANLMDPCMMQLVG